MQQLLTVNSDPLFEQVRNKLKGSIVSGELRPAERLPAQTKLAKQFGVSQITVRRAIQELVNEGLLVAHSGSGTYVATTDQTHLKSSSSRSVAIIFEDITGGYPLVKPLFAAIREQCKEANYILQFIELPRSQNGASRICDMPDLDIAGAILTSPFDVSLLAAIMEKKIPHVLLHNDMANGRSYSVSCNYASGIMQASMHLMAQGCRDILLITAGQERYSAGQMKLGFELAFAAMPDVQCSREVIHASYEEENTYDIIRERLAGNKLPDGIILASDGMAKAALNALLQAGVSIPQEVAVVSFGDTLKAHDTPIELTSVNAHNEKTGAKAMSVLHQLITKRPPEERRFVIEPELIVRASSLRK